MTSRRDSLRAGGLSLSRSIALACALSMTASSVLSPVAAQTAIRPMQLEASYNTYTDGNGVVNLACILGLAKAIEYLESVGITKVEEHNLALRNRLYKAFQELPHATIVSPPPGKMASPMLTLLLSDKFERQPFVKMLLDKHNISIRPTHKEFGFNGIRFSMHIFNTKKEVDRAAEVVRKELTT